MHDQDVQQEQPTLNQKLRDQHQQYADVQATSRSTKQHGSSNNIINLIDSFCEKCRKGVHR
jgi:geranylgeranyl pyrophosphate synthase